MEQEIKQIAKTTQPCNLIKEELQKYLLAETPAGISAVRSSLIRDILRWKRFKNLFIAFLSLMYIPLYGYFANYMYTHNFLQDNIGWCLIVYFAGVGTIYSFAFGFLLPLFTGLKVCLSPDLYLVNYFHELQKEEDAD